MIIFQRSLIYDDPQGERQVRILAYAPQRAEHRWCYAYEIEWPRDAAPASIPRRRR